MNRLPLILSSTFALILASCAPSDEDKDGGGPPPFGYELAVAGDAPAAAQTVVDLSVEELELAREYEDVRLIDIRRDDEVAGGMILGAEHIAMEEFDPAKVVAGDDRPIILYCRSGRRSRLLGETLAAHTGKPSVHLAGGINAWAEGGNPIVTP
ncbi:MAG: rhodanese-like domain-containing protein [Pseudomonadota bacterium]